MREEPDIPYPIYRSCFFLRGRGGIDEPGGAGRAPLSLTWLACLMGWRTDMPASLWTSV